MLPLYIRRGHQITVDCTPDKAVLFKAAGAALAPGGVHHHWSHPPGPGPALHGDHWSGNKGAFNINRSPMPNVGGYWERWDEYVSVRLDLAPFLTNEFATVDSYLSDLPRPLVCIHTMGNTASDRKNLGQDQTINLYRGLLDSTDGTLILLDWDNRVPRINNYRVRHLSEWKHLNLLELYCLLQRSQLYIGVDSGPLHFTRFCSIPTLGLWTHHHPAHFALPHPNQAHICPSGKNDVTRYRRLAFNIVECPDNRLDGSFIVRQALRMLAPRRYVQAAGADLLLQHLVDRLRTFESPMTTFVDRHKTFDYFLRAGAGREKPVVVETGCMRSVEDWSAGMSTYLLGLFLREHGGNLTSVDLSPGHVAFAREWTNGLPVHFVNRHSHDFLREYDGPPIDLLYLDSADVGTSNYQECALEESRLALSHLAKDGIIMFDDTVWSGRWDGKGALAIPWLLEMGFQIVTGGYQVVLQRSTAISVENKYAAFTNAVLAL